MKRVAMPPRSTPLRRSGGRIDQRAVRRRAEGGKRAVGRRSLSSPNYAVLQGLIWGRAGGTTWGLAAGGFGRLSGLARCEACGALTEFVGLEHAVPRSQGGADTWANCWLACGGASGCHRRKEAPFSTAGGRLLVSSVPDEPGIFLFVVAYGEKRRWTALRRWLGGRIANEQEMAILTRMGALE